MDADARSLFSRPWAIEPMHGAAFVESMLSASAARAVGVEPKGKVASVATPDVGGVRVLHMAGPMLHKPPAWLAEWGVEYTDTLGLAAQVSAADADPSVKSIVIRADTPGGMVGGVPELADAISGARKNVSVQVDGMLASAGVWAAAGAKSISATRSSEIGSIGVYTVRVDTTQALANKGISVHLVSSGGVKGAGADGKVTSEMLAEDARIVGQLRDEFVGAVSKGRKRDLSARATGQMWLAADALRIGLIDTINGAGATDSPMNEESMDLSPLAALAAKHPTKAADILNMAAAGKTDGEIAAALSEQVRAEEVEAIKSEAAIAKEAAAKAALDLKAEQDAHAATRAELEKLKATGAALTVLATAGTDPGPDAGTKDQMTAAKFAALTPMERAVYLQSNPINSILP